VGQSSTQGILTLFGNSSGSTSLTASASAAGTMTIPSATDTLMGRATVDTQTNKTIDAEATGNNISVPAKAFFAAAGCNNATAGSSWDIGTSNAPTAACAGSNVRKGVLQFARGNVAYISFHLPLDWNSGANIGLKIGFTTTDTTSAHVTSFSVQTGCNKTDGTATDDPALNTANAVNATNGASNISGGEQIANSSSLTTTGCVAGYDLDLVITRNNTGTDTNTDTAVAVKWAELTFSRTMNAANR